ncbi:hypothetical protein QVD17_33468 [Tagetes erecta]|uniref:Dof zinc finger protein n=1 Tax=Tagetes erecta TaxID=13708 RepID=A0AAD8JYF5_TARER|nr:hypothetical protein QVD17_33468 [Tagetes erecta]
MSEPNVFQSRKQRRSSKTQRPNTRPVESLTCPRCESTNTKFCYYNNYNKTQPRYFCKACKRHWTNGGILRNVQARKNKRLQPRATTDQETHDLDQSKPICGEKEDDESYTDIEELKGTLVSWDFLDANMTSPRSFIEMIENDDDDDLASATSCMMMMMTSCEQTSSLSWNDLDAMALEDLNKPWEDPTFKT